MQDEEAEGEERGRDDGHAQRPVQDGAIGIGEADERQRQRHRIAPGDSTVGRRQQVPHAAMRDYCRAVPPAGGGSQLAIPTLSYLTATALPSDRPWHLPSTADTWRSAV